MRITDVFIRDLGPFQEKGLLRLSLDDSRVLLRGLSGSGKSTLLSTISFLWCKAGEEGRRLPRINLKDTSFLGMIIKNYQGENWFIYEGYLNALEKKELSNYFREIKWLNVGNGEALPRGEHFPNILLFDQTTSHSYHGDTSGDFWFLTDENIKQAIHEEPAIPGDIKNQLAEIFRDLIANKQLFWEKETLYIKHLNSHERLPLNSLSTGEKSLFYLFYGILAYLKPKGVLLLDEPAFYLHPEQIKAILTAIEGICRRKEAQLIIVSHNIEAWERYEALGLVVDLSPHIQLGGSEDE